MIEDPIRAIAQADGAETTKLNQRFFIRQRGCPGSMCSQQCS
jgi:hypothetical protein